MIEQSLQGYSLVLVLIFLGFLVVCIPRPRATTFESEEAKERHMKRLQTAKMKKKKSRTTKSKGKKKKSTKKKKK